MNFPSLLPLPQLATHRYDHPNTILRTEMDSGYARQRQRFQNPPTPMKASWKLNSDQLAVFEGWLMHLVAGGTAWFTMKVKTPLGLLDHQVRFVKPPTGVRPLSGNLWEISADVEIKDRAVLDAEMSAILADGIYTFAAWHDILSALEKTVNFNTLSGDV